MVFWCSSGNSSTNQCCAVVQDRNITSTDRRRRGEAHLCPISTTLSVLQSFSMFPAKVVSLTASQPSSYSCIANKPSIFTATTVRTQSGHVIILVAGHFCSDCSGCTFYVCWQWFGNAGKIITEDGIIKLWCNFYCKFTQFQRLNKSLTWEMCFLDVPG